MTALRIHTTAMRFAPGHRAMIDPKPFDQRSPYGRRLRELEAAAKGKGERRG